MKLGDRAIRVTRELLLESGADAPVDLRRSIRTPILYRLPKGALNAPPDAELFSDDPAAGFFRWDPVLGQLQCFLPHPETSEWMAHKLAAGALAWNAGGLIIHSAAVEREGVAVLALAASGGGKSTFTDLTRDFACLSDEAIYWNPSAPFFIEGTSFRSTSSRPPILKPSRLGAILFLEKSTTPSFTPIEPGVTFPAFLAQIFKPPKALARGKDVLARARRLAEAAPHFRFCFPKSDAANDLLNRLFDERLQAPADS